MKIGIVTYWQTQDNYGQVLQAYALQYLLKQMGHEPYIIRFDDIHTKRRQPIWKKAIKLAIYPLYSKLKKWRERERDTLDELRLKRNALRNLNGFRDEHFAFRH